jgi:hypothetical protein
MEALRETMMHDTYKMMMRAAMMGALAAMVGVVLHGETPTGRSFAAPAAPACRGRLSCLIVGLATRTSRG